MLIFRNSCRFVQIQKLHYNYSFDRRKKMALIVLLKILPVLFLLLPKITSSVDFYSIVGEQTPFIIDMCKLNGPKSVIFLYTESTEGKSNFQYSFLYFHYIYFYFPQK